MNPSISSPGASVRRGGYFDSDAVRAELARLEGQMQDPGFWDRPERAKVISQKVSELREELETWDALERELSDLRAFAAEIPEGQEAEFRPDIERQLADVEKRFEELEFFVLFDGRYDKNDAIVSIHAGAGGTEAQDWAEMLMRMLFRFAEKRGWSVALLSESKGQEAGIKSATFEVKGRYAYGYLKSEHGVHRLVRISPYDASKSRHTSFALIEVIPDIGEAGEVTIDPKDIRIDTFLAGGHGGQGVQTTYSAVRVVHLPTGIIVSCQNERSQQQNKETAMKVLRAKLHALKLKEQEEKLSKLRGEYHSAEWGSQIRSYVLQPYQMVKDLRTRHETSDTRGVLDGDLLPFIEAYLKWQRDPKAYLASHAQEDDDEE